MHLVHKVCKVAIPGRVRRLKIASDEIMRKVAQEMIELSTLPLAMMLAQAILLLGSISIQTVAAQNASAALPVVDLGYELYRASSLNTTTGYYEFSDLRYAAPPTGNLRWKAPVAPSQNRTAIQDSNRAARTCPQSNPSWQEITEQWLPDYVKNGTIPSNLNLTGSGAFAAPGATETEDCLFLDVVVPKTIFDRAQNSSQTLSPVLVWIHGGGFVAGSKTFFGSPISLVQHSQNETSDGVVYVSLNYRLGFLGFLGGPTFIRDGLPNVAFYDQRLALQWIQDNIHLFGGDKNQVTVMGESGGGGSIMHQITAFNGQAPSLFKRAVIQSPAWFPYRPAYKQEAACLKFFQALNVNSLSGARNATSAEVIAANSAVVALAAYSNANIGPVIDGTFITRDPKVLLENGQFDKSLNIMVSHTSDEGLIFVPPITNDTGYATFLRGFFEAASQPILDYIETLYPAVFNGSYGYHDQIGRAALTVSEGMFVCNTITLNEVFNDETLITLSSTNVILADAIQDYATSYAMNGIPKTKVVGVPEFVVTGATAEMMSISSSGIVITNEGQGAIDRCRFWQLALQY
ncbi:hypothetical protein G7Y89_g7392 [Cudoniella acicularis]|uniref:Carboxylic ester hydrolase n=1 Tax=Cudoniella acicularis TaxID=354080 RepID=A0A8H4W1L0_9HELO|nr:hypothetical protein G7Y89_g7392 [Cudoniella acicularis]